MKDNLVSFLRNVVGAGEVESKDATFRLNPRKLRERFQTFQQADPAYCFLRFAQAAVQLGANSLHFTLSRSEITMTVPAFTRPLPGDLTPEKILEQLYEPRSWDRITGPLSMGLLSGTVDTTKELRLHFRGRTLFFGAEDFFVKPGSSEQSLTVVLEKTPNSWFPSTAKEHAALTQRLAACPVPVRLDTHQLAFHIPLWQDNWYKELGQPFTLARAAAGLKVQGSWKKLEADLYLNPGTQTLTRTKTPAGMQLWVDADLQQPGRLVPLLHGVAGEPVDLPEAPGLTAFIDASDHPTDLSGLALHDPSSLKTEVRNGYLELLLVVEPHLDQVTPLWYDPLALTKGLGSVALFSGELVLVAAPVLAALGLVEGTVKAGMNYLTSGRKTDLLREGLRARLQKILVDTRP